MIQFFRRIRQKLLTEGKLSKYLIYAIGEIALVMIGILLALQVSNWNESRKEKIHENTVTLELAKELNQNHTYIKGEIEYTENRISALKELLALTATVNPNITYDDFNRLYSFASGYQEFIPIDYKLGKILNNEDFKFSRSERLHNNLLAYSSHLAQALEYYQYNVDTYKEVNQPYLISSYPLRDFLWLPDEIRGSRHSIDHLSLIQTREFESILANIYADVIIYHRHLMSMILDLQKIQVIIDEDYNLSKS